MSLTQEDALLLVGFALLSMPTVLFAVSHLLTPVLVARYVLPWDWFVDHPRRLCPQA